jgi:hypothetical protein
LDAALLPAKSSAMLTGLADSVSASFWSEMTMPHARRARAIAVAKAEDRAVAIRIRLLMVAVGATAALLALPVIL